MVHGKNRIPYWIEQSLTGLAGPEYDATISFGLPFELGDCPYGNSRSIPYAIVDINREDIPVTPFLAHCQRITC